MATSRRGIPWLYRLCVGLILLWTLLCAVIIGQALLDVAQSPLPQEAAAQSGVLLGAMLRVGTWAVVWVIPTLGLGIIGLLVRPR